MRHVVAYEGVDHGFGYILAPGSLKFPEGDVPVTWNFNHNDAEAVWGKASDFRREEDGSITAEITFNDEARDKALAIADVVGATFWATEVVKDKTQGIDPVVTSAKIRSGALSMGIPWRLSKEESE